MYGAPSMNEINPSGEIDRRTCLAVGLWTFGAA
jgi:hypothetical protein